MLPNYFDHIFVHLRQKARLRPESSPKYCQLWARTPPENPGPTYNSASHEPRSAERAAKSFSALILIFIVCPEWESKRVYLYLNCGSTILYR